MDNLLSIRSLTKKYGETVALRDVTIEIPAGRIIGLLGKNGSGKTTLIKIVSGLLVPDSGEALIEGDRPGVITKGKVSYLSERPYFPSYLKVSDCVDYFADFYSDFDRKMAEDMFRDLSVPLDSKLKALSKGTREKVRLVLVMSRRAKLYLLDEPIAGVDPVAREYILKTVVSAYNKEASVIISTHLIADVEAVLDDYIFIREGVITEYGSVPKVRETRGITLDAYFREVFRDA